ncbi:MAG TPA: 2OG-Fe(II) oxygenase [Stellaceae bacterium]|nr:2OG-Fe(II) oxygenase [Stellaceae bacterium]
MSAAVAEAERPIASAIDLARYPLDDLDGPGAVALIAECRRQLAATGSCLLTHFLTDAATAAMAAEARALEPLAHRERHNKSTAYLEAPDESFPEGHPKRRLQPTSVGAIAYDLIPRESLIRRLYEWDGLLLFLERALGRGTLYRYADPLGGLNVAAMGAGEALLWHFDQTDFVVSLMLQKSIRGGVFEYVPHIRSADAPNYGRVQRLLEGSREEVIELDLEPGTLALFEGRYSIHRVSPIEGPTTRLIALLGYDTKPGTMSSERLKLRRYGRIA